MVVIDVATCRATHNYNCMFACFSNPSIGSRPVAVAAKIGCKRGEKLGHGPGKRGPKNLPPKIFTTFFWLDIWCRLWFCCQTWPAFVMWLISGRSKLRPEGEFASMMRVSRFLETQESPLSLVSGGFNSCHWFFNWTISKYLMFGFC